MKILSICLATSAAAVLSACGGSTNSDVQFSTTPYDIYDQQELDFIADGVRNLTALTSMPTSDTVDYEGYIELETQASGRSDTDIAGAMSMRVDLGDNRIFGAVTDVAGRDGSQYAGALEIGLGIVQRPLSGPVETIGAIVGSLVDAEGDTVDVDAEFDGVFRGTGGRYIDGLVTGTVTTNGVVASIGDGDFIVER